MAKKFKTLFTKSLLFALNASKNHGNAVTTNKQCKTTQLCFSLKQEKISGQFIILWINKQ